MHFYGIDPQKFLPTPKCLYLRKSSKSSPGIFLPYFIFYVALRQISRNVLLSKMAPELEFLTQNIIFLPKLFGHLSRWDRCGGGRPSQSNRTDLDLAVSLALACRRRKFFERTLGKTFNQLAQQGWVSAIVYFWGGHRAPPSMTPLEILR